jgi:hypothetical protein
VFRRTRVSVTVVARDWIDVETPERTWRFDARFLRSSWRCIYGGGCRGLHRSQDGARADGCCTVGAGLTDAEDFLIVSKAVARLDPARWQFHKEAANAKTWFKRLPNGRVGTRVVQQACIFLNRPGFATGPGCAFHFAATEAGESHIDWKPNVCWQFPIRRSDHAEDGKQIATLRAWRREDWQIPGGPLEWWCTDAPEAFDAPDAVYNTLAAEFRTIVGDDVYDRLLGELHPHG